MTNDLDVLELTKFYEEHLPKTINEILSLWDAIKMEWDEATFENLHLKIHSLCGSSGLYGYQQINQITNELQIFFLSLKEPKIILAKENLEKIEKLLEELNEMKTKQLYQ
jgi:HPt (histidine-containing phosphotransfer) domain-containing protein